MANFEFEKFWDLVNTGEVNDSNLDMKEIRQGKYRLLAIWSNMTGRRHLLGEYRNLSIYSRRQGWSRFHLILNPKEAIIMDRWSIDEQDICDALRFANEFEYVVTFATYKSGATFQQRVHFQSVPNRIEAKDFGKVAEFVPFHFLFEVKGHMALKKKNFIIELITPPSYPILCARIEGKLEDVALKVFSLSIGYDNLKCMNFIIEPLKEKEQAKLYFFPRRFDSKVISDIFYNLPLGPFEMGGIFPLRGRKRRTIYDNLQGEQLIKAMKDVGVVNDTPEETHFVNLIKLL